VSLPSGAANRTLAGGIESVATAGASTNSRRLTKAVAAKAAKGIRLTRIRRAIVSPQVARPVATRFDAWTPELIETQSSSENQSGQKCRHNPRNYNPIKCS